MTRTLSACAGVAAALLLSVLPASAQNTTLTATLNGGEEVPIVLTGAVATIIVSVDPVARELAVELRAFNLPTGTTAGHIHIAPRGISGPVVIDFPINRGVTGDFNQSFRIGEAQFHARPEIGINTIDDAIQAIVAGNSYANIHTTANGGGEMRGQLTVPQRTVTVSQDK